MSNNELSLAGLNIAILHYSNSIIDLNKLFGMQMMELGELKVLKQIGINATLSAKEIIGTHEQLKVVPHSAKDKVLLDIPFYQRFLKMNPDADIYQGNATPLLALFQPEKTIIRFDGVVPLPLIDSSDAKKSYSLATYIFVSNSMRNYYLKTYPFLNPEKCHVLYNAVDIYPEPERKKSEKFKMLFCSRWSNEKGLSILLRALSILQRFRNDYEVYIAGGMQSISSSSNTFGSVEEKVKKHASSLKNVEVIGYMPHDKLVEMYADTDLLVFPSIYPEPFGLIPAEAAVAGVPTCAFSIGALPEVVKHNETGVLIPYSQWAPVNVVRLARVLSSLIGRREELAMMGVKGREQVISLFNWENYGENLQSIYRRILKR